MIETSARAASLERKALAFEHASQPMALADAATQTILECNLAFAGWLGYGKDELSGLALARLFGTQEAGDAQAMTPESDRESGDACLQRKDGSLLRVHLEISAGDGQATGFRIITLQESNDSARLAAAERRVAELEAQLQGVLDTVPVGLGIAEDAGATHIRGNRSLEEMLGMPRGAELSKTREPERGYRVVRDGRVVPAEELPVQRACRGERVEGDQLEVVCEDGRRLFLLANAAPLHDAAGAISGAVGAFLDVTQRVAAESRLAEQNLRLEELVAERTRELEHALADSARSRERFELAMRGANDGLWDWDMRTGEVYYSPRWKAMLGYGEDELEPCFRTWERLVDADGRQSALELVEEIKAGRTDHFEIEFRMRHKQGHEVYMRSRAFVARTLDGKPVRMVGTHVDVTADKLHEQGLRASREYARSILDSVPAELAVLDRSGQIRMVNEAWRRFVRQNDPSGSEVSTYVGLNYLDVCRSSVGDGVEGAAEAYAGILGVLDGTRCQFTLEYPCHSPSEKRWFQMTVTPLGTDGAGVVVSHMDISERRKSEEALLLSEKRYRSVVENQTEIICSYLPDNRLCFVNDAFCSAFGGTREQLLGRDWHELVDAEEWPQIERLLCEMSPDHPTVVIENRVPADNGTARWMQFVNCGVYDEAGERVEIQVVGRDITERKLAELALQASENRLKLALKAARMGVWERDLRQERLIWSPECHAIYDAPGFGGDFSDFERMILPADAGRVAESVRRAIADGSDYAEEYRILRGDGELRWVSSMGRPEYDEYGQPLRVVGIVRDITERKRAEAALKASEARSRRQRQHLVDVIWGTNIGTWEWNVQTGATEFNERWAEICGYSLAELQPVSIATWTRLAHPEDLKRSEKLLELCFSRQSEYYECEARMRHKSGQWIWVLDRGRVVEWGEDGRPLRMSGTHQEITERKRAEEALMRKTRELRALLDTIPAPVFFKDQDMRHVEVNQAFCEFVGLPAECIIGCRNQDLFSEDVAASYDAGDQAVLQEGRLVLGEELEIVDAWGRKGWYAIFKSPLYEDDGRIVGLVGLRVDITQRKQGEAERIALLERQRDTLIREVHHRIKNHLQGVIGLLRGHVTRNPETLALIDMVVNQVHAISQVYGLQSRTQGGVLALRRFLEDMVTQRPALLPVELSVAEGLADANLTRESLVPLALVINELLTNAEKHMLPSGPPTVQARLESRQGGVVLRIFGSPARLPDDFDFLKGRGVGAGLDLVRSLLPEGVTLSFREERGGVVAELVLTASALMPLKGEP